jgi:hypothetical protein
LRAQAGVVAQPDSVSDGPSYEREDLFEQAAQTDGSPVLDFIPLDPDPRKRDFYVKIRSRVTVELERSRGYTEGLFPGSPLKSEQRAEFSNKRGVSGGILLSKDPGERLIADFVSGYGLMTGAGGVSTLVVGDYFIEAGQGIALWRGFDYGKGPDVVGAVKRNGRGILPYRSSDENAFLRGVAAGLRLNSISLALFYSRRQLSASVDSSGEVSSISTSGTLRTESEISKRNNLSERLIGFRSSLGLGEGRSAGITYYNTIFSLPLNLSGGAGFSGKGYGLASVDYQFDLPGAALFGEWTVLSGAAAGISGAMLAPSGALDLIGAFRRYPPRMPGLHGLGFGGQEEGEEGVYLALRMKLTRGIALSAYIDQFRFPEGTTSNPFPGGGSEWLARLSFRPDSGGEWFIQFQRKSSERAEGITSGEGLAGTLTSLQFVDRIRAHFDFRLSPAVRLRGRIEKVYVGNSAGTDREHGMMLYEDVACSPRGGFSAEVRVIFFLTGSYETRLYEFEQDLAGATSLPLLSGEGQRWYLLARYRLTGSCEISAKYSRMTRDDVKRIGSGPDELPGNFEDRIGLQLDFRL